MMAELLALEILAGELTSPYWSREEMAAALAAGIGRAERAGWKWAAPWLEKGTVRRRPTALMATKSPADRDFNPRRDAFALRLGAEFIEIGPWAGQFRLAPLLMRHDGTLLDPEACPECQGSPFMVQVRSVRDRSPRPRQIFTYCRRCISPAEVEEIKARQQELAAMPARQKPARRRSR